VHFGASLLICSESRVAQLICESLLHKNTLGWKFYGQCFQAQILQVWRWYSTNFVSFMLHTILLKQIQHLNAEFLFLFFKIHFSTFFLSQYFQHTLWNYLYFWHEWKKESIFIHFDGHHSFATLFQFLFACAFPWILDSYGLYEMLIWRWMRLGFASHY